MSALSVIIITYNEEPDIRECLESVTWADELVVVDCGSSDGTVEICREYTEEVHVVERHGSGPQKQMALDLAHGPWILNLDADERVTDGLREEIWSVLDHDHAVDAYHIPRTNYFLGRMIRYCGWQDDRPVRLFRKSNTRVTDTQVHEGFVTGGSVADLSQQINHLTYKSLFQYFEKMNEYTSIEVRNRLKAQPDRHIGWVHFTLAPLGMFWKLYILRSGFRDGLHGLLLCVLSSISQLVGYSKVWEYQMRRRNGCRQFPPIRTEELTSRQPGYNRLQDGGDDEFNWKDA